MFCLPFVEKVNKIVKRILLAICLLGILVSSSFLGGEPVAAYTAKFTIQLLGKESEIL